VFLFPQTDALIAPCGGFRCDDWTGDRYGCEQQTAANDNAADLRCNEVVVPGGVLCNFVEHHRSRGYSSKSASLFMSPAPAIKIISFTFAVALMCAAIFSNESKYFAPLISFASASDETPLVLISRAA